MRCFQELQRRLIERGYYPYRLGIQAMDLLNADKGRTAFLRTLKGALDPNNVLARGRYVAADPR